MTDSDKPSSSVPFPASKNGSLDSAQLDPIFANSLRESYWIVAAWLLACVWTIGTCAAIGYETDENLPLVFGMPAWVFWGVLIPWVASTMFTIWFAMFKMADGEFPSSEDADSVQDADAEPVQ